MDIRIVSLDRTPERFVEFSRRNGHLRNVQRVPAVDGSLLNRADLVAGNVMAPGLNYTNGALGCAMSHAALWNQVIRTGQAITIGEDDAVFCGNFEAESERCIATLPPNWEVVTWGYNYDTMLSFELLPGFTGCNAYFDQPRIRRSCGQWPAAMPEGRLFRNLRSLGTACYSISPRGAERLMKFCFPLRPLSTFHPGLKKILQNFGIDNMMAHVFPYMDAYVSVPPLVLVENDVAASTVQTADDAAPVAEAPPTPAAVSRVDAMSGRSTQNQLAGF